MRRAATESARVFGAMGGCVDTCVRGCGGLCLLVVALVVGLVVYTGLAHPPLKTVALRALLPTGDLIEYGWVRTWRRGWGYSDHFDFLAWERGEARQVFLVFAGPISSHIELRVNADHDGVWLVDRERREVMATLDLGSGQFLDVNGEVKHGRAPLKRQERTRSSVLPYPGWAVPDGGELVAEWDYDDAVAKPASEERQER